MQAHQQIPSSFCVRKIAKTADSTTCDCTWNIHPSHARVDAFGCPRAPLSPGVGAGMVEGSAKVIQKGARRMFAAENAMARLLECRMRQATRKRAHDKRGPSGPEG